MCKLIDKDFVKYFIATLLGAIVSLLTTCMNNYHSEKLEKNKDAIEFIRQYNNNYIALVNCKRDIIQSSQKVIRDLNSSPYSKEARESYIRFNSIYRQCVSNIFTMKLISQYINLNTNGNNCLLDKLNYLNNLITQQYNNKVFSNSKDNSHVNVDKFLLIIFPDNWDSCLKINTEEISKFTLGL